MPELRGTVVLATYNSGASVGPVLAEIEEAASVLRRSGIELEVLLVDDSSPDNTAAIATDEAARLGIKIEILAGSHLGLGRSQLAGFDHLLRTADRDFFVTLDPWHDRHGQEESFLGIMAAINKAMSELTPKAMAEDIGVPMHPGAGPTAVRFTENARCSACPCLSPSWRSRAPRGRERGTAFLADIRARIVSKKTSTIINRLNNEPDTSESCSAGTKGEGDSQ